MLKLWPVEENGIQVLRYDHNDGRTEIRVGQDIENRQIWKYRVERTTTTIAGPKMVNYFGGMALTENNAKEQCLEMSYSLDWTPRLH